jgi:hemoglobin/transferrin/lactoferrin receptor protein
MNKFNRLIFGFTFVAITTTSYADELPDSEELDSITITATRSERNVDQVSRSVSIISQETIVKRRAADVPRLLREQPGISEASNGGLAGQLVIRGFSTQGFRAPLFVDGDRFRGRNTIEYSLFNPEQIERVEVIRGPASSLYGTDSFGGVINIITKRASLEDITGAFQWRDNSLSFDYATVNDLFGGRLQLGGAGNGFDILMGANLRKADDFDSPAGEIPNSGFDAPSFDLRTGYTFAPGQRLEFTGRYSDIERERAGGQFGAPGAANGPGIKQRLMTDRSFKEKYARIAYTGESLLGGNLRDVEASFYWRDLYTHVNVVPNARKPAKFVDVFVVGPTVIGGRLKGVTDINDALAITVGSDWYYEDRDGTERSVKGGLRSQRDPDTDQLNIGIYGLAEFQATDALQLSGSLRYDHTRTRLDLGFITDQDSLELLEQSGESIKNNPVTGSVGMVWNATDHAILFGNVSTSFRTSSVTELAAIGKGVNRVFRVPNLDIKPEKGINYEAGLRLRYDHWQADIAGFYNDLEDLIERNAPVTYKDAPAVQIQNIGEAEVYGVEMQMGWLPTDDWYLSANATYTRGTDKITDTPLTQIMPWNGFVSARWEPIKHGYYLEGTFEWALDKDRINPAQERKINGYGVFNLYGGFELDEIWPGLFNGVTVRLAIENLFDKEYRLPAGVEDIRFPVSPSNPLIEPGRNFMLGLNVKF